MDYKSYFDNRGVQRPKLEGCQLQPWQTGAIPKDMEASILDIGCGYGVFLSSLRGLGYSKLKGIDICEDAVSFCVENGLEVEKVESLESFVAKREGKAKFDFITMSHVLEHIPKDDVVATLKTIRERLMAPGAALLVSTPNAQANTGAYWAYEDFTHHTIFTSGSLLFVLRSAGFTQIEFVDPDGLEGASLIRGSARKLLLSLYKQNYRFWNFVTRSSFHSSSPQIHHFELKALAKS